MLNHSMMINDQSQQPKETELKTDVTLGDAQEQARADEAADDLHEIQADDDVNEPDPEAKDLPATDVGEEE
jgi:hypothetical protein